MKANYHTHTARCGHATGTDEEYVRAALSQGFDVLGFSDHVPWPYHSGFTSPHVRMDVGEIDAYLLSVRSLQDRYRGQIALLAGFECEYFPAYIDWLRDMAEEKHLDYLILGNHYDLSDETGMAFARSRTPQDVREYVETTVKGIQTGLFSYLAHPDVFMRRYPAFDDDCAAAARDLCQACRDMNIPMEYNLHMLFQYGAERAGYPNESFFEVVCRENMPVIIGIDAHAPQELSDPTQLDRARDTLKRLGAHVVDHIDTRGGRFTARG